MDIEQKSAEPVNGVKTDLQKVMMMITVLVVQWFIECCNAHIYNSDE